MKRAIVITLFIVFLTYSIFIFLKYIESRNRDSTTGQITTLARNGKNITIEYWYSVENKEYYNHQYKISVVSFMSDVESFNRYTANKQVGDFCTVYYNPKSISDSSLSMQYSFFELIIASVTFLLIGIFGFLKIIGVHNETQ